GLKQGWNGRIFGATSRSIDKESTEAPSMGLLPPIRPTVGPYRKLKPQPWVLRLGNCAVRSQRAQTGQEGLKRGWNGRIFGATSRSIDKESPEAPSMGLLPSIRPTVGPYRKLTPQLWVSGPGNFAALSLRAALPI